MRRGESSWLALGILSMVAWIAPCSGAQSNDPSVEDSGDFAAVQTVCTRCHSEVAFLKSPRSWIRWNEVFEQMTARGATGTDDQLARVTRYFLSNLTIVNANTSPAEEIAPVLGVSNEVAEKIVLRRERHRFSGLSDLRTVAGVDRKTLDQRKARILF